MNQILFENRPPKIFWTVVVLGNCLIVGCSPIYNTQHSFTAPLTQEGKICLSHCENTKLLCEQNEEIKREYCELRMERALDKQPDCFNLRYFCHADYYRCETHYIDCYQSCGGTVKGQETCVIGCD